MKIMNVILIVLGALIVITLIQAFLGSYDGFGTAIRLAILIFLFGLSGSMRAIGALKTAQKQDSPK